jgi:hypothetical protein
MSVTIFNPKLDKDGKIAQAICTTLGNILKPHSIRTAIRL